MEMVSSGEFDHVHISFMIAGHTKFATDRRFSMIGGCIHDWQLEVYLRQECNMPHRNGRASTVYSRIEARASISFLALKTRLQNETGV
jgi:hypothetical protein